jgi:hypothetical protein
MTKIVASDIFYSVSLSAEIFTFCYDFETKTREGVPIFKLFEKILRSIWYQNVTLKKKSAKILSKSKKFSKRYNKICQHMFHVMKK